MQYKAKRSSVGYSGETGTETGHSDDNVRTVHKGIQLLTNEIKFKFSN